MVDRWSSYYHWHKITEMHLISPCFVQKVKQAIKVGMSCVSAVRKNSILCKSEQFSQQLLKVGGLAHFVLPSTLTQLSRDQLAPLISLHSEPQPIVSVCMEVCVQ